MGTTRLEEMSESEKQPPQETPTQDANESTCKTKEVAAMRSRMPRILVVHSRVLIKQALIMNTQIVHLESVSGMRLR